MEDHRETLRLSDTCDVAEVRYSSLVLRLLHRQGERRRQRLELARELRLGPPQGGQLLLAAVGEGADDPSKLLSTYSALTSAATGCDWRGRGSSSVSPAPALAVRVHTFAPRRPSGSGRPKS